LAVALTPDTDAVTVYGPLVPFAVNVVATASPEELVLAVVVNVPLSVNTPLAFDPGALKVTVAFATGLFEASRTIAPKTVPNAVLIAAVWASPCATVMEAGLPAGGLANADSLLTNELLQLPAQLD